MSAMNSMRKKEQEGEKQSEKRNFGLERHIRCGSKECGGTESAGRGREREKNLVEQPSDGRVEESDQHTRERAPRSALNATTAAPILRSRHPFSPVAYYSSTYCSLRSHLTSNSTDQTWQVVANQYTSESHTSTATRTPTLLATSSALWSDVLDRNRLFALIQYQQEIQVC